MRYYSPPTVGAVVDAMREGIGLGAITTPKQGNRLPAGVEWVADNGRGPKRNGERGTTPVEPWWRWLERLPYDRDLCAFAVAPDVVADADATLELSLPWLPRIRSAGYPAAYVGQDGATPDTIPWPELDVLFLGGSTDWKLGPDAAQLARHAIGLGKPVHLGRVNSLRRMSYGWIIGASSADGTLLTYGPDRWLPMVRTMLSGFPDWTSNVQPPGYAIGPR